MPQLDDDLPLVARRRLPETTVARLPRYLRALENAAEDGDENVSSRTLADVAGVNAAIVRKDLSYLGGFGTRGVGYEVAGLVGAIQATLGIVEERAVVIIGAGNLGRALAAYGGFGDRGFRMAAVLDADPRVVGAELAGLVVRPLTDLHAVVAESTNPVAVLAIPAEAAQEVVDLLADAGVSAVLNFAPAAFTAPASMSVRSVDLSTELQVLSFYDRLATTHDEERSA